MKNSPTIFCLIGPTAIGKTDLALLIASMFPIDIINVDSAQIYRGMDIGTAKPSKEILDKYPHFLIDIRNPEEEAKLKTRRFQDRLAESIFQGARTYFLLNPPQDTLLANNINSDTQIISYIVKRGDTLSEIAELYNVKLSLIKNFNGISGSTIRIGQSLQIPLYR